MCSFNKGTQCTQCCLYVHGCRAIYCIMGSLLWATHPKKTESFSSSSHQLLIVPQPGVGPMSSSIHDEILLAWSQAGLCVLLWVYVQNSPVTSSKYWKPMLPLNLIIFLFSFLIIPHILMVKILELKTPHNFSHRTWRTQAHADLEVSSILASFHSVRGFHECDQGKSNQQPDTVENSVSYSDDWPGEICPLGQ